MSFLRVLFAFFVVGLSVGPILLAKMPFSAQTRRVVKIDYLENCDQKAYPIMFIGFSFTRNGSATIINGEQIISRDIKNPMIRYWIEKCKDKSNPDTCEYYTTWKWDNVCGASQLPFVKPILDASEPPLTCPIKKNHHYIKNAKLYVDLLEAFLAHSNSNVLWKIRMELQEDTSIVACANIGIRLMSMRIRV